ncbi:MAG: hypothetical protein R3D01_05525 [Hyphomicrobiales bacterium]
MNDAPANIHQEYAGRQTVEHLDKGIRLRGLEVDDPGDEHGAADMGDEPRALGEYPGRPVC